MLTPSSWKYESLYSEMLNNYYFEPIVIIIPFTKVSDDDMHQEMKNAEEFCIKQGYKYTSTWNVKERIFEDIKRMVNPDIIFFSHPYPISYKEYSLTNYLDVLSCWVPYSIRQEALYKDMFDQLFHNMFWRNYSESAIHLEISKSNA